MATYCTAYPPYMDPPYMPYMDPPYKPYMDPPYMEFMQHTMWTCSYQVDYHHSTEVRMFATFLLVCPAYAYIATSTAIL